MAILLTGGTGKTAVRLARLLQDAKISFLLASRRGKAAAPAGMPATKFDLLDSSTFETPFQYKFPCGESISAIYLVSPIFDDPETSLNAFVDHAFKEHGVKRFVCLAATADELGKPGLGKVWQHLVDLGVEYCVLRPTWFMENFLEDGLRSLIKNQGKLYTATGNGKAPFVSADDIAAVAYRALTDEKSHNTDYFILGPELLNYDELAAKLSSSLGRECVHVKLTRDERSLDLKSHGVPDHLADVLTLYEVLTAGGEEARENDVVQEVTGRPPKNFDTFVQENKAAWE